MDERQLRWAVETLERLLDNALVRRLRVGKYTPTIDTIYDEDTMASDSATGLATQQSIKAYVDTEVAGVATSSNLDGGVADTNFGGVAIDADGGDATSF